MDIPPGRGALLPQGIDPSLYENLVESAPDAVVLIDSNGNILLVNQQTESLFGHARAELIGKPIEMLVPGRYRDRHTVHRDAYFAEPKVRGMGAGVELSGLRKDGTEFPLEISLSPLRTKSGVYATASVRDITDRKRTQQQFRALLESAPDAMVIISQRGEIMLVNAQTERMFGYQREALVGKKVEVLIPERLRGRHLQDREGYFHNPKVREMGAGLELWGRRKNGTEFPIEISLSPLETEGGTWATAAVRDVTDAKRERDAAVRLAAIVESSNDAIIGKDLEGRITSWNRGAELLYGFSAAEMLGQPVTALFPPENLHEEQDILERVRRGEQIKHFETQRLVRDGSRIEVSLTISPIHDAAGRVIGASTIARDISERRRADERFRALLETAPEAMVIIDVAGRIVLINAQTERVFGYPRAELIGQSVEILVPEGLRESHGAHRARYFESPKVRPMGAGLELLGRRKDGSTFPIEISLSPMAMPDGQFATAAVRDITERKAVERQLASYAEDLRQSNVELEQFAYVASHDLQAPLRNVVSFAHLLERAVKPAPGTPAEEYLKYIVSSTLHMQALIRDLLAYSRAGRPDEAPEAVSCEEALRQVLESFRAVIRERNAVISHDPLPMVMASMRELMQILQNLIGNGLKFQPGAQPRVHVSAQREGRLWRILVRDYGIGIRREHQQRIFQIFQRLHSNSEFDGTGIGLALCQKIVTHLGGTIRVESEEGKGSTFSFTLPAAPG